MRRKTTIDTDSLLATIHKPKSTVTTADAESLWMADYNQKQQQQERLFTIASDNIDKILTGEDYDFVNSYLQTLTLYPLGCVPSNPVLRAWQEEDRKGNVTYKLGFDYSGSCLGYYSFYGVQVACAWEYKAPSCPLWLPDSLYRKQYVYLIGDSGGAIKIGTSANPEKRLQGLRRYTEQTIKVGNLKSYQLLATTVCNSHLHHQVGKLETTLHRMFCRYRLRGEWFLLPDVLRAQLLGWFTDYPEFTGEAYSKLQEMAKAEDRKCYRSYSFR